MARAAPIGREGELEQLLAAAAEAGEGRGSVVFLAGPTGSGKSALLKALSEALAGEGARPEPVSVLCYETSAGNPLGPFGEVLRALTSRDRRGDRAKRVLELVGQVAPPLVELIPVIGKLAAVGVKAAADVGVYAFGGSHETQQAQLASDVAVALRHVAADSPIVVVIDEAQWIDAPSTEVIARLADGAEEHALCVVVAYDPDLLDDRRPLARVHAAVFGRPGVHDLALADLSRDDVDALLVHRYGSVAGDRLADWLHDLTEGNPLFLEQYLATLEEQGVLRRSDGGWMLDGRIEGEPGSWSLGGALAAAQTPDSLLELLRPRVADLDDEERALLETGAVQGRRFLSSVIVRLLEREEDEILDRLSQLAERRRMIEYEEADDWWTDRSALFSFDPGIFQELLYGRYARSPYERRRRHRAVAEALEALIEADDPPPRQALLEIARHYEQAHEPLKAATRLVEVAESTFAEGADRETAANAERAVALLREVPADKLGGASSTEAQRLLARAILLVLLGGEPSWHTDPSESGGDRLVALAKEAEQAAEAAGDARLKANARYATALVVGAYLGLHESIAAYREALELARAAADPVAEFAILVNLGLQLDSVDLREGWDVLQEASALLARGALAPSLDESALALERARLETAIGVADFDLGRYGEALEQLVRSSDAARTARRRDDAGWAMAFLGQVQTAIGQYEIAEATLRDAIELFADERASLGIRGYLRALLGHLYVEWDPPRLAEARDELAAAREETAEAGRRSVQPLVATHWAELLLAEGTPATLVEADELLAATATFGWARSEIAGSSLRARVALAMGHVDEAVKHSTHAVEQLEERGGAVPAVRSEEILFTHARVLDAAGSADAATRYGGAAHILREKSETLTDPALKDSLLERVRLSREILAAGG